jgi:hypothetical protein
MRRDQPVELGDRVGIFPLLGQELGVEHGGPIAEIGDLGQRADGRRCAREIAGAQLKPGHALLRTGDLTAAGILADEPRQLVLGVFDPLGLDERQVGQDLGFAEPGGSDGKRLGDRIGRGGPEQLRGFREQPRRL